MSEKVPELKCSCGGHVTIGYGYDVGSIGSYVVCDDCHFLFLFLPDLEMTFQRVSKELYEKVPS